MLKHWTLLNVIILGQKDNFNQIRIILFSICRQAFYSKSNLLISTSEKVILIRQTFSLEM